MRSCAADLPSLMLYIPVCKSRDFQWGVPFRLCGEGAPGIEDRGPWSGSGAWSGGDGVPPRADGRGLHHTDPHIEGVPFGKVLGVAVDCWGGVALGVGGDSDGEFGADVVAVARAVLGADGVTGLGAGRVLVPLAVAGELAVDVGVDCRAVRVGRLAEGDRRCGACGPGPETASWPSQLPIPVPPTTRERWYSSGSDWRISFGVRRMTSCWKVAGHTDTAPRSNTRWVARKSWAWSLLMRTGAWVCPTRSAQ